MHAEGVRGAAEAKRDGVIRKERRRRRTIKHRRHAGGDAFDEGRLYRNRGAL